ncbi:MAG: Gfo/Idh/MocA family oxidoreductase [Opitutales bacterium]|nr:Gfo/Idh/MocA family oxidoreductase [Opitutales bacterium]
MKKISRRSFAKYTALSMLGVQIVPSRVLGRGGVSPSGRINMAIIGNGLISRGHRRYFARATETQIFAVCDVHQGRLISAKKEAEEITKSRTDTGFKPIDAYTRYQDVLERDDIDAVCVATPDHWHVAIALKAIEMGKAVYVEKPMSLTVEEGRILSDAVKRKNGILQVGTQQRSEWAFRKASEFVRNGYIGNIKRINTQIGVFPQPPKNLPEEKIPDGFDYDAWLGQTPYRPYNSFRVLGDYSGGWRCFYEYGQRKDGDWGAHHFDIIQWALGMDNSGPTDFYPANTDGSPYRHYKYANGIGVYVNAPIPKNHMIQFIGDEGEIFVSRAQRFDTTPRNLKNLTLKSSDERLQVSIDHRLDFIDAIRFGKQNVSPVEVGHRSATVCHLMSISSRIGKHVKWDPNTEKVIDNKEAEAMLSRPRRYPYFLGV